MGWRGDPTRSKRLGGIGAERHITVTTIYIDTDYVLDQMRWKYAAFLEDRLDAQGFVERIYTEPAQILRLGEDLHRRLAIEAAEQHSQAHAESREGAPETPSCTFAPWEAKNSALVTCRTRSSGT